MLCWWNSTSNRTSGTDLDLHVDADAYENICFNAQLNYSIISRLIDKKIH